MNRQTKTRATEEALGELHKVLAEELTKGVKYGQEIVDDEGKLKRVPPTPAFLNTVRQFLKDNKIEAVGTVGSYMGNLSALANSSLPEFTEDLDD